MSAGGAKPQTPRRPAADPCLFSVVVPTHGRPEHLARCLGALLDQELPALEIVVACSASDEATHTALGGFPTVAVAHVAAPSNLEGMRAGAEKTRGDVICFTDDDARPRRDWIYRMAAHFARPDVGAVGGRDVIEGVPARPDLPVGVVTRWGKLIGNHHVGGGGARDVDVLKGVNMAFRRTALALPAGLRGGATIDHFEVAMCLWVASRGFRVVYDPRVVVDHAPARRVDGTDRADTRSSLAEASTFNLAFSIMSLRPDRAIRRALYGLAVGDRGSPGLGRGVVALLQRDGPLVRRVAPSLSGQCRALVRHARGERLEMRGVMAEQPAPIAPPQSR